MPSMAQQASQPDSLEGFDEAAVMAEIAQKGLPQNEIAGYLKYKKSEYAGRKKGTWQVPVVLPDDAYRTSSPSSPSAQMMTPCTNMDFETGTLSGWSGSTGFNPGCCTTPGLLVGRQDIVTGAGFDPIVGAPLTLVAPGGNYSVRLGNSNTGGEAETLSQTFTVSATTTSFTYQYAVVLENPSGHSTSEQPFFKIEMYDQAGNLIPCSQYLVTGDNAPGFNTCCGGFVVWKNWTTVNIDLSNYVGQNVTIKFTTADCTLGGHYGYAYIDGSCLQMAVTQSAALCTGDQITLSAPPGAASYSWAPGGQTTDSILVSNPGMYCVTMVSVTGCQQNLCVNVSQYPKPNANFVINSPNCSLSATYTDSTVSASPISTWSWDFGDNSSSSIQNPGHTYASGGLYYVELIVTTQDGCSDTMVKPLSPGGVPIANFSDSMVCLSGTFADSTVVTQGTVTGWQWNFGDPASAANNTSVFQNPSHNFTQPGVYNVTLIATSSNGCTDTVTKPVTVSTLLNADFGNTSACEGNTTTFTDLSTTSVGTISIWSWNFGDNTNSSIQNPTHQYASAGSYQVVLTASTNTGCVGTITQTVTVNPLPQPAFTASAVCFNSASVFNNQSTIATGNISNYSWSFGDNSSSSQQAPSHTYLSPGVYNVTLVLTSDSGCVDSITQSITVNPNPAVAFVADDVDGCAPHCVNFTDQSTVSPGVVSGWHWDFGDGNVDTLTQNAQHCFNPDGSYTVTLTAITNNGCTSTLTLPNYITAYPSPTAGFTAAPNPTTVLSPLVQFTDQSTGGSQWQWSFGDGDTLLLTVFDHPTHVYSDEQSGDYMVYQIVTSPNGCRAMDSLEVIVQGDFSFYIPNAFTPNGDGKNDFFFGTGDGIEKYEIYVFDRWGNKLFYGDNLNAMWDGRYSGKLVEEDVYVWKVNLMDIFHKKHVYVGHVTVIR